jgi:hypothetical protein
MTLGTADKLLEAQKELMRAEMKLDKAKNFRPTVQIPENDVQTTPKATCTAADGSESVCLGFREPMVRESKQARNA